MNALDILRLLPGTLRDRAIRRLVAIKPREIEDVTVKVASTAAEIEAAARVLHDAYVARGLLPAHASGVRVTPHLILPTTATFIAKRGDEVVGTMALILDGPLGLPMDKIYGEEIAALRAQGRKLAEVGALCVAKGHRRQGISFLLNKIMLHCARELLGVDDLVIAVHPDAEVLYRAALLFHRIGPTRSYPGLNKTALATALRLDVRAAPALYLRTFGKAKRLSNPYHMYVVDETAQLEMPAASNFLEKVRLPRMHAAAALARARPDAFADLGAQECEQLRRLLPNVLLPQPLAPQEAVSERRSSGITYR